MCPETLAGEKGINCFQQEMLRVRERNHGRCVVCGADNATGLHVDFQALSDGSVEAEFSPHPSLVGYPGRLHGGVIAALLDGAMTNCLFANDIIAVTAELTIRYRAPVAPDLPVHVGARIEQTGRRLYRVAAWVHQGAHTVVTAGARFIALPNAAGTAPTTNNEKASKKQDSPLASGLSPLG